MAGQPMPAALAAAAADEDKPVNPKDELDELFDASLQFTSVLKKKGVSQATLMVAVRCRPLTRKEKEAGARLITRLVDQQVVVVMDPEDDGRAKPLGLERRRSDMAGGVKLREKRYVFDKAFDGRTDNKTLYMHTVRGMIPGVLKGLNATVFAYGATGSGKTYTMVGSSTDPGLMVLSMNDIFEHMAKETDKQWDVTCSYCEVYNEQLYDLLMPSSTALDLREDPEQGAVVAGLSRIKVQSAEKIFKLLEEGNQRRKTESTDANAMSSRSHAVLEIAVCRSDRNHYQKQVYTGKLALVDLAGSERASETNNFGRQLKDGANINRSLLALANCINALGKRRKKGFVFVPFRNSKLTRLLKDGLCGNSRTTMIATVASSAHQYHHTVSTLKYANRAKEIKTHVRRNAGTVQEHIAEYQAMIDALQEENAHLKGLLAQAGHSFPLDAPSSLRGSEPGDMHHQLSTPRESSLWVEQMSRTLTSIQRDWLDLQRANFEAEDIIIRCQAELASLDATSRPDDADMEQRRSTAQAMLADADLEKRRLHTRMLAAESKRVKLQEQIAAAPKGPGRERLQASMVAGMLAVERAQMTAQASASADIIADQQDVIDNLWRVLGWAGLTQQQVYDLAAQHKMGQDSSAFSGGSFRRQSASNVMAATPRAHPRLDLMLQGTYTCKRAALWGARQAQQALPASSASSSASPSGSGIQRMDSATDAAIDSIRQGVSALEDLNHEVLVSEPSGLPGDDASEWETVDGDADNDDGDSLSQLQMRSPLGPGGLLWSGRNSAGGSRLGPDDPYMHNSPAQGYQDQRHMPRRSMSHNVEKHMHVDLDAAALQASSSAGSASEPTTPASARAAARASAALGPFFSRSRLLVGSGSARHMEPGHAAPLPHVQSQSQPAGSSGRPQPGSGTDDAEVGTGVSTSGPHSSRPQHARQSQHALDAPSDPPSQGQLHSRSSSQNSLPAWQSTSASTSASRPPHPLQQTQSLPPALSQQPPWRDNEAAHVPAGLLQQLQSSHQPQPPPGLPAGMRSRRNIRAPAPPGNAGSFGSGGPAAPRFVGPLTGPPAGASQLQQQRSGRLRPPVRPPSRGAIPVKGLTSNGRQPNKALRNLKGLQQQQAQQSQQAQHMRKPSINAVPAGAGAGGQGLGVVGQRRTSEVSEN